MFEKTIYIIIGLERIIKYLPEMGCDMYVNIKIKLKV